MIYRFNMNVWPISTCFATKVSIFSCKDEAKKFLREAKINTRNGISRTYLLINKKKTNKKKELTAIETALNKKRLSITRTTLCKARPVNNFADYSINIRTNPYKRGLNLIFKRKKRIVTCFAFEDQSVPWKPEKKKVKVELEGPSIWIVEKVQSLTEKLIHGDNINKIKLNKRDAIIPNKQFNPRESQLYAFGLASHYQLQKNLSKIEVGLRQGCQLFTVYVFSSFCWLYLIKYSSKTNDFFKVDSLFQDTLFETLPLFSEKGIVYVGSSKASLKTQSRLPSKSQGLGNCEVIDGPSWTKSSVNLKPSVSLKGIPTHENPLLGNDQAKDYATTMDNSLSPRLLSTSSMGPCKLSALEAASRQTNHEIMNSRNQEKKNGSNTNEIKSVSIELTPLFSEKLQNYIGKKKTSKEESQANQGYSKSLKERLVPLIGRKKSPKPVENLIFFARRPLFKKDWFSSPEYISKQGRRSIVSIAYPSFTSSSKKEKTSDPFLKKNQGELDLACLTFKKQTLTQKKAYDLSGTSMIIDPEIDFLPRKLEECVNFSKIYFSYVKASVLVEPGMTSHNSHKLAKQGMYQDERYAYMLNNLVGPKTISSPTLVHQEIEKHIKVEERCFVNFKPYFTLTESLLWCKPLIKTKTQLLDCKSMTSKGTWFLGHKVIPLGWSYGKIYSKPKQTVKKQKELKKITSSLTFLSLKTKINANKNKIKTNSNKKISTRLLNLPLFLDIFLEPRLQSGFQFANAPISLKNNEKLKGGLGITINPQLLWSTETKAKAKLLEEKGLSNESLEAIENKEKTFFDTNIFLEWLYEPDLKSEYLFYNRANDKLLNLQKKTSVSSFIVLDKHTDFKTSSSSCFLEQNLSSQKTKQTFVEKVFSYKRNSFTGLLDAPENFFGTPYLKLGERFTIEKLKSKNRLGTLYSIHSGKDNKKQEVNKPTKYKNKAFFTKPYASMGASLKTVFGKKQFTTPQNQTSKKKTVQNLITNARLVTSWSKDPLAAQNLSKSYPISFSSIFKEKSLFSIQEKDTNNFYLPGESKTDLDNNVNNLSDYNTATASNSLSSNVMLNKAKIFKILEKNKRISGKANRNIILPFKYYNPGIKRERNIEDTMLILEGYKKSRLFPTIHTDYRGIATRGLPITIPIEKSSFRNQDYELQSILLGMRQRTETQRIAENLSQPSKNNLKEVPSSVKRQEQEKEKYDLKNNNNQSYRSKPIKQNKKRSGLSNYYPLLSSLVVRPQEAFPEKALGATNNNLFNKTKIKSLFSIRKSISKTKQANLKGSIQTKGFYFEKLFNSGSQTNPKVINDINNKKNKVEDVFSYNNPLHFFNWILFSINIVPFRPISFSGKIIFFAATWYGYKLLATPLSQSTQFLPATFTEAIGLQSFQQKYRIIKGEKKLSFSFKNIAGAEKTLSELRDLIWTFRLIGTQSPNHKSNLFTLFPYIGSRIGQSRNSVFSKSRNRLLLAGPPGTGKTLLVKALAAEANLPVIVQPVSSLRMISGVENPVSALFHVARQIKPCIIFLDELDTLGNDYISPNNYTAEQKLGIKLARKYTYTLLLELDGLTSNTRDLLIIGATNRLETLNPALTRAGRFDTLLDFNLPSQEARTSLFSFYLGTKKANQNKRQLVGPHASFMQLSKNNQANQTNQRNDKKKTNLNLVRENQSKKSTEKYLENYFKKIKTKDIRKDNKLNDNLLLKDFEKIWIESYLAEKCYGLSHASIGTIINESALESMLYQGTYAYPDKTLLSPSTQRKQIKHTLNNNVFKPLHTLETLERAINSVKTLTKKSTANSFSPSIQESDNILSLNSSLVPRNLRVLSMCHDFSFLSKKERSNGKSLDFSKNKKGGKEEKTLIKPFTTEFLVNRVYQTVGSLIVLKKQERQEETLKSKKKGKDHLNIKETKENVFLKDKVALKIPSIASKPTSVSHLKGIRKLPIKTKKPFFLSSLTSLAIKQKYRPINKKDHRNLLLQEYSGYACLSIYTVSKPLTFKIGASTGLFQDPSYVAATISTLKSLTHKNSVFTEPISFPHLLGQVNQSNQNTKANISENLVLDKTLFSGFVKESNLPKGFFSNPCGQNSQANRDPSYLEQKNNQEQPEKTKADFFWKSRKGLNKSFSANNGFNKHSKEARTHIMDVKAANPLTTSWFRIYFSRPFFRYDTFHYIENKEYYPKNNYILKRNKKQLFQRNVSTLSHTSILCNSNIVDLSYTNSFSRKQSKLDCFSRSLVFNNQITGKLKSNTKEVLTTEKKGKFWSKENIFYSSFLTSRSFEPTMYPKSGQQTGLSLAKENTKRELNCFSETKESLYLALVASIFQKGIQFFQKNRELTDYCAYTFLRYGVLYEFYLEAILKKFKI